MKLSRIGLGTVLFGKDYGFSKKITTRNAHKLLNCAIYSGVYFVDTSPDYGDSEKRLVSISIRISWS